MEINELIYVGVKLIKEIIIAEEFEKLECIDRNKIYMIEKILEIVGIKLESENIKL